MRLPRLLALILAVPSLALAEDPSLILAHSGRLIDGADQPVSREDAPFKFRIVDRSVAEVSETEFWKGECAVDVVRGVYGVMLGGTCGTALKASHMPPGALRFLEVTVDGIALAPRLGIGVVPNAAYAAAAGAAQTAATAASAQSADDAKKLGGKLPEAFWARGDDVEAAKLAPALATALDAKYAVPPDVARTGIDQTFAKSVTASSFSGKGTGLTDVPADAISGVLAASQIPASLAYKDAAITFGSTVTSTGFIGNGALLTGLDASKVSDGTLADARLSANVALLGGAQTFTGAKTFGQLTASSFNVTNTIQLGTNTDAPCSATNQAGQIRWNGTKLQFCDGVKWRDLGVASLGKSESDPGASCKAIKTADSTAASGVYWIDPDGLGGVSALQMYCEMSFEGGGWTLALHSFYKGAMPPTAAHAQDFVSWENLGIGRAQDFTGATADSFYFLPLKYFKAVAATSQALRFESAASTRVAQLDGFTMTNTYGLDGSNEAALVTSMCAGSPTNCFLNAPGFSAFDRKNDRNGSACSPSYSNVGWWYDNCFSYNPHYTVDRGYFSGYTPAGSSNNHWTWWVR